MPESNEFIESKTTIKNIFYNASAGSGKTFKLCSRYIALLFSGASANEILTLTFTKKAANEMKSRITNNLFSLYWRFYIYNEKDECPKESHLKPGDLHKWLKDAQNIISELYNEYGITESHIKDSIKFIYFNFLRAEKKISTIDSFFTSILRKFAFYIGIKRDFDVQENPLDNGFREFLSEVYTSPHHRKMMQYIFQDLNINVTSQIKEGGEYGHNIFSLNNALENLNDKSIEFISKKDFEYKLSVEHILKDSKDAIKEVLGTQDIEQKILANSIDKNKHHIINNATLLGGLLDEIYANTNNKNIRNLSLTFSSKDIDKILKSEFITKGTRHFYFKKIGPELSNEARESIDSTCLRLSNLATLYYSMIESEMLRSIFHFIDYYKKFLLKAQRENNILSFDAIKHRVFEIINDDLRGGDSIFNRAGGFSNDASASLFNSQYFYFRLDSMISHILFDEYQDTSIIQYRIFAPIFGEILSGSGTKEFKSVFFVGDSKQSLYGFRGANIDVFTQTSSLVENKSLSKNYRSKKNIVDFINEKFSVVFAESYVPQEYSRIDSIHRPSELFFADESSNKAQNDGFVKVQIFDKQEYKKQSIDSVDGVFSLDSDIDSLKKPIKTPRNGIYNAGLENLKMLLNSGIAKNNIAILARNRKILDDFVMFAKKQGFKGEFNLDKSGTLINKKPVQIISCIFKIQKYEREIAILESKMDKESYISNKDKDSRLKDLKSYLKFTQKKLNVLLHKSYENTNFLRLKPQKTLAKEIKFIIESLRLYHSDYVQDCLDLLQIASENHCIKDFDELSEKIKFVESSHSQNNAINIMTIHKSKGLEFDYVIYLDATTRAGAKGRLLYDYKDIYLDEIRIRWGSIGANFLSKKLEDLIEKIDAKDEIQEKNIMYVAISRAKKGLFIIADNESKVVKTLNLSEEDSKYSKNSNFLEYKITESIIKDSHADSINLKNLDSKTNTPLDHTQEVIKPRIIISHLKTKTATQEDFLRKEDSKEPYIFENLSMKKRQIIGLTMHYFLELSLGYGIKDSMKLMKIVESKYGFYLDKKELFFIYKRAENFLKKDMNNYFDIEKSVIKCELSFLQNDGAGRVSLNRIDSIIFDDKKFYILEFKSTQNITESLLQEHQSQLKKYIRFLHKNLMDSGNFRRLDSTDFIESRASNVALDSKSFEDSKDLHEAMDKNAKNENIKGYLIYLQKNVVLREVRL